MYIFAEGFNPYKVLLRLLTRIVVFKLNKLSHSFHFGLSKVDSIVRMLDNVL